MRIEEVQVEGYGVLADQQFSMKDGLVCVLGENESGKSTLLAFVRAALFGFRSALTKQAQGVDKRTAPYDPVVGGRKGGSIVVCVEEEGEEVRYRVERVKVRSVDGELTVEDLTRGQSWRGPAAERMLGRLTGNTSEVVFSNVFAVGLDELHAVSSMQEDEVRSVLFTADAGVGTGFVGEMRRLEDRLEGLYKPRGQKPELNRLLRKREEVRREIRVARRDLSDYEDDRKRLAEAEWEQEEAQRDREKRVATEERARQRIRAREHLTRLEDLEPQASLLRQKPLPDAQVVKQVTQVQARLDSNKQQLVELEQNITHSRREREAVRFNSEEAQAWLQLRALPRTHLMEDLDAANEADRYQSQLDTLAKPHLDQAGRETVRRLLEERDRIQERIKEKEDERLRLVTRIDGLRAEMLPEQQQRAAQDAGRVDLQGLQQSAVQARDEAQQAHKRLEAALRGLGDEWDTKRLAQVPVDATTVTRVANALPGEAAQAGEGTPGWVPVSAFVAGVVMILAGVGLASFVGLLPMALVVAAGLILVGVAALIRGTAKTVTEPDDLPEKARAVLLAYGLEGPVGRADFQAMTARVQDARGALDRLESAESRSKECGTRLEDAQRSVREAADLLGVDAVGDLREVSRRLAARLEDSREASSRLRVTIENLDEVDAQEQGAQKELTGLEMKLDKVMKHHAVTDETSLLALMETSRKREDLQAQLERVGEAKRRFDYFHDRFAKVLAAIGQQVPPRERFPVVVGAVYARCEEAFQQMEQAQGLDRTIAQKREAYDQALEERSGLEGELEKLLAAHEVEDVAGLERRQEEARRLVELEQQIQVKNEALRDLEANMPGLREEAARVAPEDDQLLLARSDEEKQEHQARMQELRERIRELGSRLDRLDSSDRLGELLSQEKAVEAQLAEGREVWAELALTRFLLERARQEYEDKHGPEVLKRASDFLSQLTGGRYERLVAAPDGSGHQLVMRSGRRVPAMPPHVSRGLFAQTYLFVRLAYSEVMRREVPLPYVLDDVLSDFDETRLVRAAGILGAIARERQVVLFTHHAHVAEVIDQAGGTVVGFQEATGTPGVEGRDHDSTITMKSNSS